MFPPSKDTSKQQYQEVSVLILFSFSHDVHLGRLCLNSVNSVFYPDPGYSAAG